MFKLNSEQLTALGAPMGGGAMQIEDWLRTLLRSGAVRLENGLVELRGSIPVVTTLGDLKKACGVAVETVKQGLRTLEMDHWVLLVDGAHTRLLGPPRFRIFVTKENFWGSVGRAIEVEALEGMSPVESIDYERLSSPDSTKDGKMVLSLEPLSLSWNAQVRLTTGKEMPIEQESGFLLAAGSVVRAESGVSGVLPRDVHVTSAGGRELRTVEKVDLLPHHHKSEAIALPPGSVVELERSNLIRLPTRETGILFVASRAETASNEIIDWGVDNHWLGRFKKATPLVLFRRAIYASLEGVVATGHAAEESEDDSWRIVLGVHDCVLDGTIPYRAGRCSLQEAPANLIGFLAGLKDHDSMRAGMEAEYGVAVGHADVRTSPAMFASAYDRRLLRGVASDARLNAEVLSVGNKVPCWAQVGAYSRVEDVFPWEVTRELYFPHVSLHYRQGSR